MFKKKDLILVIPILLIFGVFLLFTHAGKNKSPDTVKITISGQEYATYPLSYDREIEIDNDYGHNKIIIKNSEVYMEEANCPDKYCTKHEKITESGNPIICLPHKLVVEITSNDLAVDGVTG